MENKNVEKNIFIRFLHYCKTFQGRKIIELAFLLSVKKLSYWGFVIVSIFFGSKGLNLFYLEWNKALQSIGIIDTQIGILNTTIGALIQSFLAVFFIMMSAGYAMKWGYSAPKYIWRYCWNFMFPFLWLGVVALAVKNPSLFEGQMIWMYLIIIGSDTFCRFMYKWRLKKIQLSIFKEDYSLKDADVLMNKSSITLKDFENMEGHFSIQESWVPFIWLKNEKVIKIDNGLSFDELKSSKTYRFKYFPFSFERELELKIVSKEDVK